MGRNEFVGQDNKDWDSDPDYLAPITIQRQPLTPAMSIKVEGKLAKLVTKNPITSLTSEEVGLMIESMQEVKDFLDNH